MTTKTKSDSAGIFVATQSGCAEIDGEVVTFHANRTHVREGHKLLERCPDYFAPAETRINFEVEDASAEPGRKRGSR